MLFVINGNLLASVAMLLMIHSDLLASIAKLSMIHGNSSASTAMLYVINDFQGDLIGISANKITDQKRLQTWTLKSRHEATQQVFTASSTGRVVLA